MNYSNQAAVHPFQAPQQAADYEGDYLISFINGPEGTLTVMQELDLLVLDMNIEY